jgi:hypothetical protein
MHVTYHMDEIDQIMEFHKKKHLFLYNSKWFLFIYVNI